MLRLGCDQVSSKGLKFQISDCRFQIAKRFIAILNLKSEIWNFNPSGRFSFADFRHNQNPRRKGRGFGTWDL